MAIESQGVQVRRQSTAAGSTGQTIAATIAFSATGITRSDGGSFVTDGFSTGMRVETDSSANSTRVFTLSSVSATSMSVYETLSAQSTGATITITGHDMEAIGQVMGFNGPSGSANVIDITHLGSTAKEKMIGLRDEGQLSIDIIYDTGATALHTALKDDRATRTQRIFDITLTDNGTASSQPSAFYFDSYVTNLSITGAVDDVVKGSITLEITSAVHAIDAV
ncbi:MAG: hypothetical protein MJA29_04335 [Candidatus Omnitrophica bacterium]|nr:hypothetical protein [Candidatus Omnitrophota bacterium]